MQSGTLGKRELNNLWIRGRIVKRIYDNPDCNITFIIKGDGIPKNSKSLRKRIAELQKTDYFQTLIPWHEECFHIYLKNDPDFLSFRTFCRTKNDLSIFCDHDDYIKNSNAYKEFIASLGVESLHKTAKRHFRKMLSDYHYKLKQDKNIRERVLRILFRTYHKKIRLYLRVESYNKKNTKPRISLNIARRMDDITEFIMIYFVDFAKKINTPDFEEYAKEQLLPNLTREYKATEMVLTFAMEDLVAKNMKPKRKIPCLNERVLELNDVIPTHFEQDNPKYIRSRLDNIIQPIMDKNRTPDFSLIDKIVALEQGQNWLVAGNYTIDDLLHNWMKLNPIKPDLDEINKGILA